MEVGDTHHVTGSEFYGTSFGGGTVSGKKDKNGLMAAASRDVVRQAQRSEHVSKGTLSRLKASLVNGVKRLQGKAPTLPRAESRRGHDNSFYGAGADTSRSAMRPLFTANVVARVVCESNFYGADTDSSWSEKPPQSPVSRSEVPWYSLDADVPQKRSTPVGQGKTRPLVFPYASSSITKIEARYFLTRKEMNDLQLPPKVPDSKPWDLLGASEVELIDTEPDAGPVDVAPIDAKPDAELVYLDPIDAKPAAELAYLDPIDAKPNAELVYLDPIDAKPDAELAYLDPIDAKPAAGPIYA